MLIASLVTAGLPMQWRLMRLRVALGEYMGSAQTEEDAHVQIFKVLQLPEYKKWSFNRRVAMAKALIPEFLTRKPRLWETAAGLLIYGLCLYLPIYIGLANIERLR